MMGTLISISRDSFTVFTGNVQQTFPRSVGAGVEVFAGSHTHKAEYALYGAAGGAMLGASLGLGLLGGFPECDSTIPHCDGIHPGSDVAIAEGIFLGLLGSGIGAIIGHFHRTAHWTSIMSANP